MWAFYTVHQSIVFLLHHLQSCVGIVHILYSMSLYIQRKISWADSGEEWGGRNHVYHSFVAGNQTIPHTVYSSHSFLSKYYCFLSPAPFFLSFYSSLFYSLCKKINKFSAQLCTVHVKCMRQLLLICFILPVFPKIVVKLWKISRYQICKARENCSTFAYPNFSYVFKGRDQIMKKLHEIKRNQIFLVLFFFYRIRIPTYSVLQSSRIVSLSKPSVFFIPCRLQHRINFLSFSLVWFVCWRQRWYFRKLLATGGLFQLLKLRFYLQWATIVHTRFLLGSFSDSTWFLLCF